MGKKKGAKKGKAKVKAVKVDELELAKLARHVVEGEVALIDQILIGDDPENPRAQKEVEGLLMGSDLHNPLAHAITHNKVDIVKKLLDPPLNAPVFVEHLVGAIKMGSKPICKLLLRNPEDRAALLRVPTKTAGGHEVEPPERSMHPSGSMGYGLKPIHLAAQSGDAKIVEFLLEMKADINTQLAANDDFYGGWSALHFAADAGSLEVVKTLLLHDAILELNASDGATPLALAAEHGRRDVVSCLVAEGAELNIVHHELSAVQWAAYRGSTRLVELMVSHGAKLELEEVVTKWFPPEENLKTIIARDMTHELQEQLKVAIFKGGRKAIERQKRHTATHTAVADLQFPLYVIDIISRFDF